MITDYKRALNTHDLSLATLLPTDTQARYRESSLSGVESQVSYPYFVPPRRRLYAT